MRRFEERRRAGDRDPIASRLERLRRTTQLGARRPGDQLPRQGLRLVSSHRAAPQPADHGPERFARHAVRGIAILELPPQLGPRVGHDLSTRGASRSEKGLAAFRGQAPHLGEQLAEPEQCSGVGCREGCGQVPREDGPARQLRCGILDQTARRLSRPCHPFVARVED